ncbi:MAG: YcxB family protein [Oscillospiraceae bacterium]|nr:YcxB family protein [Oscillospiraceae bacterium]
MNERAIMQYTEHSNYGAWRKWWYFSAWRRPMRLFNLLLAYVLNPLLALWFIMRLVEYFSVLSLLYVLVLLAITIGVSIEPRVIFNRNFKRNALTTVITFYENHFEENSTRKNETISSTAHYDQYRRVHETKDAFYIQHENKHWGFFPKTMMSADQATALRELFACKFGEKFKGMK